MTTVQIRTSTRERLQQLSAERFESLDQVIAYGLALIDREAGHRQAAGLRARWSVVNPDVAAAPSRLDDSESQPPRS